MLAVNLEVLWHGYYCPRTEAPLDKNNCKVITFSTIQRGEDCFIFVP